MNKVLNYKQVKRKEKSTMKKFLSILLAVAMLLSRVFQKN